MDWLAFIKIWHFVGVALGVGGATVSDALFFKSIKNKKISNDELALLKEVSKVIWVGLIILILSGAGILLFRYDSGNVDLVYSAKFWAKMTIVAVIFINGLVFHNKVFPFLRENSNKSLKNKKIYSRLWLLAITGAISIISWYSAFILGALRNVNISYINLISFYTFVMICGILLGRRFLLKKIFGK